jgi:hypothetical protein
METIAQEKYETGNYWQELVAHELSNMIKRSTQVQCCACGIWGTKEQMVFMGIELDENENRLVNTWKCICCCEMEWDVE